MPQTDSVSDAVILMAGTGSRLNLPGAKILKPLAQVRGRSLISYTFDALLSGGIKTVYAIVGFEHESLVAQLEPLVPHGLEVRFVQNPDWQKQNGISVLAAADHVSSPFLLTMSDHLFDQSIIDLLLRTSDLGELNLAVDRKIDSIFDIDDAMKVQTRGDRVVAIGKDLKSYDAIDTGLFVCPGEIFDYLNRARQNGDCSLADGVRLMATAGKVRAVDIGNGWWQDVDTQKMLEQAEKNLARGRAGD